MTEEMDTLIERLSLDTGLDFTIDTNLLAFDVIVGSVPGRRFIGGALNIRRSAATYRADGMEGLAKDFEDIADQLELELGRDS